MHKLSVDDKGTALVAALGSRPWLTKTTRHAECNLPWDIQERLRDLKRRTRRRDYRTGVLRKW